MSIIPSQDGPCLLISVNAATPEVGARIRELLPQLKISAQIIERGTVELEMFAGDFKCVDDFVWSGWIKPVDGEAAVYLLCVKRRSIVSDDNIRFMQKLMERPD